MTQDINEYYLRYPEVAARMKSSPFKVNYERLVSRILSLEAAIMALNMVPTMVGIHQNNLEIFRSQTVAEFSMYFGEWPDPNKDLNYEPLSQLLDSGK